MSAKKFIMCNGELLSVDEYIARTHYIFSPLPPPRNLDTSHADAASREAAGEHNEAGGENDCQ